jgi:hypothetical protein
MLDNETIIRRVLDSFDSAEGILNAVGYDLWDLVDLLIDEGYINEETVPHVFNDIEEYYHEENDNDD